MDRGNSPRLWYYFDPCRTCTAIRSSQVGCVHGGVDRPRVRPACRRQYGRPAPAGLTGRGARQVLRREGHGRAADVWSLGFEPNRTPSCTTAPSLAQKRASPVCAVAGDVFHLVLLLESRGRRPLAIRPRPCRPWKRHLAEKNGYTDRWSGKRWRFHCIEISLVSSKKRGKKERICRRGVLGKVRRHVPWAWLSSRKERHWHSPRRGCPLLLDTPGPLHCTGRVDERRDGKVEQSERGRKGLSPTAKAVEIR